MQTPAQDVIGNYREWLKGLRRPQYDIRDATAIAQTRSVSVTIGARVETRDIRFVPPLSRA
jgi:hypothetical protein